MPHIEEMVSGTSMHLCSTLLLGKRIMGFAVLNVFGLVLGTNLRRYSCCTTEIFSSILLRLRDKLGLRMTFLFCIFLENYKFALFLFNQQDLHFL